jgi:BirA family biotin operon repressor/biotin-[acetyl-CoA-carboxylase] ligase
MREKILQLLASGEVVSGDTISTTLGISRTAVWKHIRQLRQLGYDVAAVRGNGYQLLCRPDKVNSWEMAPYLTTQRLGRDVIYLETVDSTNRYLRDLADQTPIATGTVVCAETQTAGRGRFQRHWESPAGGGIWFSLLLRPQVPPAQASHFTLAAAVAVSETLRQEGISAGIKWPNDVLVEGRKVCGILAEMRGDCDNIDWLILGIGLNVGITHFPQTVQKAATSLALEGKNCPRPYLAAAILNKLEPYCMMLETQGFSPIRQKWRTLSCMLGDKVTVHTPKDDYCGIAEDLDENGCLVLRLAEGGRQVVLTGDVLLAGGENHE